MSDQIWLTWPEAIATIAEDDAMLANVRDHQRAYGDRPTAHENTAILVPLPKDTEEKLFERLRTGSAIAKGSIQRGQPRVVLSADQWKGVRCYPEDGELAFGPPEPSGRQSLEGACAHRWFFDPVIRIIDQSEAIAASPKQLPHADPPKLTPGLQGSDASPSYAPGGA